MTFTKDVAPIVFANCVECHRVGQVAPFPLVSYGDVKKRAKQMLTVVERLRMPPWKPVEGHGEFAGERRMKSGDIVLLRMVEEGSAEGDPKGLPPMPKFSDGWLFGEPDLIVQMPEAITVPAEGRDIYRAFAIPLNLTEDKYLRASQFRPKNPRTVHHSLFFLDLTGAARKKDAADPEPGFQGHGLSFGGHDRRVDAGRNLPSVARGDGEGDQEERRHPAPAPPQPHRKGRKGAVADRPLVREGKASQDRDVPPAHEHPVRPAARREGPQGPGLDHPARGSSA